MSRPPYDAGDCLGTLETDELEQAFPSALDGYPHPRPWHDAPAGPCRGCGRMLGAPYCADCEASDGGWRT